MAGSQNELQRLIDDYDNAAFVDLAKDCADINVGASLLKYFFRELGEPLFPARFYADVIRTHEALLSTKSGADASVEAAAQRQLLALVAKLPAINFNVLKYLCEFLEKISQNEKETKMNASNLG